MTGKDILCILLAYLLGGICTGYYLVQLRCGEDIRELGSGGVGARNVGRKLGRPGFVITLIGDALKGLLAILLARWFGIGEPAVAVVLVAVIAGHIWPLPLQFRGGRGIATAIGAYIAFDYALALVLLGLTLLLMVFRRGFILSGLVAFVILPTVAWAMDISRSAVAAMTAAGVMILFAHRERIRKAFSEMLPEKEA